MKKLEYPFNISILSPEEGSGYLIEFPDLPGCISDGETLDETIVNGKDALLCWIETAKQYGDEIPLPSSSEIRTQQDENPSDVDPRSIIHHDESFPNIPPPTWEFNWSVTCP